MFILSSRTQVQAEFIFRKRKITDAKRVAKDHRQEKDEEVLLLVSLL